MYTILCETSALNWTGALCMILMGIILYCYPYYKQYLYFREFKEIFTFEYGHSRPYESIFGAQRQLKLDEKYCLDESNDNEFASEFISSFKNYLARIYLADVLAKSKDDVKIGCEYIYYRALANFCENLLLNRPKTHCQSFFDCEQLKKYSGKNENGNSVYALTKQGIIVSKIRVIAIYKVVQIVKEYEKEKKNFKRHSVEYEVTLRGAEATKRLIDEKTITIVTYRT